MTKIARCLTNLSLLKAVLMAAQASICMSECMDRLD